MKAPDEPEQLLIIQEGLSDYEDDEMFEDDEQPQYYQCMCCSWAGYDSDMCPNCCGPLSAQYF